MADIPSFSPLFGRKSVFFGEKLCFFCQIPWKIEDFYEKITFFCKFCNISWKKLLFFLRSFEKTEVFLYIPEKIEYFCKLPFPEKYNIFRKVEDFCKFFNILLPPWKRWKVRDFCKFCKIFFFEWNYRRNYIFIEKWKNLFLFEKVKEFLNNLTLHLKKHYFPKPQ